MQFSAFLLTAVLSGAAVAKYNVKLYEHRWCLVTVGKECKNIDKGDCCHDNGKKYKSGKFEEVGSSETTDNLKLYADEDCGGLDIAQKAGGKCATADDKDVKGAKVFIVVPGGKRDEIEQSTRPAKRVVPDNVFMEDGRFRYVLARNTTEGEAYEKLRSLDEQIAHLRAFGTREAYEYKED
ncbi:hypothetical protein JX265_010464 [Neoarthrinium moseri]|uniref:Uncharacterized protein n=1 Tax=Neoarthrinium moseri TaxID=1658444 RepID=A0A9Q0AKG6_9PEZI|nr:hypothetical protein JX266_008188 [Neoarthrinium moseri]KAI1859461.1 hypothetical protein JX265_010464 [Neoarthrinium moseri]